MRMFWWDGFFAYAAETVFVQYLALYAVAFGASNREIGLLSALTMLSSALAMLPGARLAERWGRYRDIVVLASVASRTSILFIGLIPLFADGAAALYLLLPLAIWRTFFGSFLFPAWTALSAEIVPESIRGRFFSSRFFGMGLGGLISAPIAGYLIGRTSGFGGWEMAWFFTSALGFAASFFYARIPGSLQAPARPQQAASLTGMDDVLADRNFLVFCLTGLLWNLSVFVAGPFFNVYLVKDLHATALWVGILSAAVSIGGLGGQLAWGRPVDVRGPKWTLVVSGAIIPLLPWAWLFVTQPWQVLFINLPGGALWAGYNVASLNLLLAISPEDRRPRYAAISQGLVFLSAFVGPLAGGAMSDAWGYKPLFFVSGAGRLLATVILWRFVTERARGQSPEGHARSASC